MELSQSQQSVVDHDGGHLVVTGGFGAGKTTALVHRWRRLAYEHGSGRVVYLARSASAAQDVRRRLLAVTAAVSRAAVGPLVVTTFVGLSLDILRRHGVNADLRLIVGADHEALVARLLAEEAPDPAARWPTLGPLVTRAAFVPEVAGAVLAYRGSSLGLAELRSRTKAAEGAERWEELTAFAERYRAALESEGAVDTAGALVGASLLLRDPATLAAVGERCAAFLVDDFETATFPTDRLLGQLAESCPVTVAGNAAAAIGGDRGSSTRFLEGFATATDGTEMCVTRDRVGVDPHRLVVCRHPSMEADAVAGELIAAHGEREVAWSDMAVLTRRAGMPVRVLARALARHGIPVSRPPAPSAAEPIVGVLRDRLRNLADDAAVGDALAEVVADVAAGLIDEPEGRVDPAADRALDAVVAFARAARDWLDHHPQATAGDLAAAFAVDAERGVLDTVRVEGGEVDGVTIATIDNAAGLSWHTVVVANCIEGQYPSVDRRRHLFDRALLADPDAEGVVDAAEHRRRSLAEERRRFAVVASRATDSTVFVAAPQPGTLVSRYVEHLSATEPVMAWPAAVAAERRERTGSTRPLHPTGALRLSASQLDTYQDCARRWFYDNYLRLSDRSSVWADFGTLVHDILENFLRPGSAHPLTLDYLLELGDRAWSEDIAPWVPQREQARRELDQVLEKWWEIEGSNFDRAQVLKVEHAFEVPVGKHVVRGRIDRIDHDPSRAGIAIIDYKTSRSPISDAEAVDDLQLAVYHLAATRDAELAGVGPPVRLELLYLRSGKSRQQAITDGHEARTEARILATADAILSEAIDPNPAAQCRYCDYHRLCPLQKAGRERGAS